MMMTEVELGNDLELCCYSICHQIELKWAESECFYYKLMLCFLKYWEEHLRSPATQYMFYLCHACWFVVLGFWPW